MTSMRTSYAPQGSDPARGEITASNGSPPPPPPRPVATDGAPAPEARHVEPRHHRHGPQGTRSTAQRQVLLIEDDEVAGETLCSNLQNLSIACTWVRNIDDARRALERR